MWTSRSWRQRRIRLWDDTPFPHSCGFFFTPYLPLGWSASVWPESVCLTNGFCIEADSHVVRDQTLIVQRGQGSMEFPAGQVAHIASLPPLSDPKAPTATQLTVNPEDLLIRAALEQGLEPEFVRSVARANQGSTRRLYPRKARLG